MIAPPFMPPAPFFLILLAFLAASAVPTKAAAGPSLLKPDDRIVFVGDSITGQGAGGNGWARLIEGALRDAHPASRFTCVSLGGSGQSVGSWQNVEKRSRDRSVILDVKNVDVRTELDQPAGVVICMLGMNDVLFPQIKGSPEDIDRWAARYRELIAAIRKRAQPRVFALATPTLCTEDLASPKNRVMDMLIARLPSIAAAENCIILPTNETMREILAKGRAARADFHVTGDFVHPNFAGHIAIATGMLRGLGESAAARALLDKHAAGLFKTNPVSYQLERLTPGAPADIKETFRLRVFDNTGARESVRARLTLPSGWNETPSPAPRPVNVFLIEGVPNRLINRIGIQIGAHATHVDIPAPWLVGVASQTTAGWSAQGFDPNSRPLACDAWFSQGARFGEPFEIEPGRPLAWHRAISSINDGGMAAPGAIDFASVKFFENFDVAYGVRWIYSPDSRPAIIQVERLGFAAGSYLTAWFNGKKLHSAPLASARNTDYPATVSAGWNTLVFRSHNLQVQWQFALNLICDRPETLLISTAPPSN